MTSLPYELEFYEISAHSMTARHSRDRVEVCKSIDMNGTGVRVIKDGAIGFSFFTEEREKDNAIVRALKSAELSSKDNYSLPEPRPIPSVKRFDSKLAKIDETGVVDMLLGLINASSSEAEPSKGEVSVSSAKVHIWNSNGIDFEDKGTFLSVFSSAKKGDAVGYDYLSTRKFEDVLAVGESAGRWAKASAGGKPADFSGPIILSIETISSFFDSCVLRNFNGENVRLGKALWQFGDKPMSPNLTIIDDPLIPWAADSTGFDDEGIPTKKKKLVEDGTVKQFLYDTRTANLSNTQPTGNGFRSSFAALPSTGATNIVVSPSEVVDTMDVQRGFFVKDLMGFHNMNPVTGDFSLDVTQGFFVRDGELEKPVKGCMLVGNFFDILKNSEFDKDIEHKGSFFSPKIRFYGKVISK